MRILQITPLFSPQMGGSSQVVYHISRELARRGHDVTVIAGDVGVKKAAFPNQAFNTAILPCPFSSMGFYITPGLIPWMHRHISDYDILHLHEVRTFQNIVARWFADRSNIPYVLSAHGTLPIIVQRQLLKRAFDLLFGRAILKSARNLIAVSPFESQQYQQAGVEGSRIRVVYNGIDLEEFDTLEPDGSFRNHLAGMDGNCKIVLFLGRLHRIKGIDVLIKAFAQLNQHPVSSLLVIAGPDEGELSHLQALAVKLAVQDRVRFVGPLYGQSRLSALADADVLAYPSAYEIFGIVPFEAIMCGTPVIATDDCGMGQIINESGAGYLVPYGNVAALKQTLQYVFSHPQEAHQKVIAGQRFIRNRLDWQMLATELESIYKPLALCGPRKMFVRRGGRPCPRTGGTSAPADDQESR